MRHFRKWEIRLFRRNCQFSQFYSIDRSESDSAVEAVEAGFAVTTDVVDFLYVG